MNNSNPFVRQTPRALSGLLAVLACVFALLGLTGCGSSGGGGAATAASDPVPHQIWLTPAHTQSTRPVVDVIAVGVSESTNTRAVAESQLQQFRDAVRAFALRGGQVRIVLFAGQGQSPALLVNSPMPPPNSGDKTQYESDATSLVGGSTQLVSQALGLTPRSKAVAQLVSQARHPMGSDDAGAIGSAIDYEDNSSLAHAVTLIDDGLQQGGGVTQGQMLSRQKSELARKLAHLIGASARGTEIDFTGLGVTDVRGAVGDDRGRTLRLRAIWTGVCERIHASCEASS